MIDVVFILLLFFMLSSTFSQWQQLSLSSVAKGKPTISEHLPVQVFVLGEMKIRHRGEIYDLDSVDFEDLLSIFLEKDSHVLVTAESRATIQDVVRVMDKVIKSGLQNVNLTHSFDER